MPALKNVLLLITLLSACRHADIWDKMRGGDFDIVSRGTYRGRLKYLPQPGIYEDKVTKYRSGIEKNLDVLPKITRNFFIVPDDLNYIYKFAGIDDDRKTMILRYFARITSHSIYAGYQIQFVFDISTDRLLQIFTSEVPLE